MVLNCVASKTPEDQFHINEKVWLKGKNLALPYQMLKLAPQCHGPFLITKWVLPVAYKLMLPPAWTIHDVFHASLLTPYRETDQHGPNHMRPLPDLVGGEEEFEVEVIVNHHYHGRAATSILGVMEGVPRSRQLVGALKSNIHPRTSQKIPPETPAGDG